MKNKIIGFYRPCDLLTMTGTTIAIIGIFLSINGYCLYAIFCLIFAGICDAFDGKLASLHKSDKSQKTYGIELDSLSDIVSFGILPIVIAICTTECNFITYLVFIFYILCGLVRLSYYNVLSHTKKENNNHFIGVPITSVAIFFPVIWLASYYIEWIQFNFTIFFLILGILYIVPIKIEKLDTQEKTVLSLIGIVFIIVILLIICV